MQRVAGIITLVSALVVTCTASADEDGRPEKVTDSKMQGAGIATFFTTYVPAFIGGAATETEHGRWLMVPGVGPLVFLVGAGSKRKSTDANACDAKGSGGGAPCMTTARLGFMFVEVPFWTLDALGQLAGVALFIAGSVPHPKAKPRAVRIAPQLSAREASLTVIGTF